MRRLTIRVVRQRFYRKQTLLPCRLRVKGNCLEFAPGPSLFRHFYEQVRDLTGSVYGRRMYEVMRIWDEDRPEWDAEQRDFAAAWRSQPKWVVSRSLKSVGPNATLIEDHVEAVIRG